MTNVTQLHAPPRVATKNYKQYEIHLKYLPKARVFSWRFVVKPTLSFGGQAATMEQAFKDAKKEVDAVLTTYGMGAHTHDTNKD